MTAPTLTRSVLTAGVWEGVIEGDPSGAAVGEGLLGDRRVLPGLKVAKTGPGTGPCRCRSRRTAYPTGFGPLSSAI